MSGKFIILGTTVGRPLGSLQQGLGQVCRKVWAELQEGLKQGCWKVLGRVVGRS